jgi:hypothetical protein
MRTDGIEGHDQRQEDLYRHTVRAPDQHRGDDEHGGDHEQHRHRRPPPPSQRQRGQREQNSQKSAPAGHGEASRRTAPEFVLGTSRQGQSKKPIAPTVNENAHPHTATLLRILR